MSCKTIKNDEIDKMNPQFHVGYMYMLFFETKQAFKRKKSIFFFARFDIKTSRITKKN